MSMRIPDIGRLQTALVRPQQMGVAAGVAFALPQPQVQSARAAIVATTTHFQVVPAADRDEKRRRSIGQGRSVMDGLDQLKLALLSGGPVMPQLTKLAGALEDLSSGDDPVLDDILESIRLRAEVEIAKAESAR